MPPCPRFFSTRRLAFVACASLLAVAACSSSPSTNAASSTTTGQASPSGAPTSSTQGAVPNYSATQNARPFVQQTNCAMVGSTWVDKGIVRNSTKSPHSFTIVVDFVTAKGNTVMNTQVVHVATIAPGHSASWTATDPQDQTGLACIVRFSQFSG